MALYSYRCPTCGDLADVWHSMHERPEVVCEQCGGPRTKVFSDLGLKMQTPFGTSKGGVWKHYSVKDIQKRQAESPEQKSGKVVPLGKRWV